ncbi:DUF3857 domain-containing protein [Fulvivirgaceae bacterium BMA10]|uniref:DUF3857 domain-containing protein n=1 Tax=Splendidivirga corallicola TaxID=3051826 RepID=A0ABT8KTA8_9BACT|nr:DUF3857 domain-containing protein [Fulvivirgaceae bacterium BMA10]
MQNIKCNIFFLLLFLSTSPSLLGSEKKYPVSSIDESLIKDAVAVVRVDEMEFEVLSLGKAKRKVRQVITILKKGGERYKYVYVGYDKFSKVSYISGNLYDAEGEFVKKLKKSDIEDRSSISGFSIYEDNRVKIGELSSNEYPYTVEYEYEVDLNGLLFYPSWYFQSDNEVSVEQSSLKVIVPNGQELRYKELNLNHEAGISNENGKKIFFWEEENIQAFKKESYGPKLQELLPIVFTAPSKFEMDGYKGDMSSWKTLGTWQNKLNEGRDELSDAVKLKLHELTADASNEIDKIKKIYEYLQSKTRYVSIQLGIGGWQPFEASFVDEQGYGDCKALSNYTKAMLKAVGINSHYVLVRAGENAANIDKHFPSRQFNHAILCVPTGQDTVWLECTSQTNPFGYLGSFTGDRDVLIVTEDGGKVVHTPIYKQENNLQTRFAEVNLDKQGNAKASVNTVYSGLQYENDDLNFMLNKSAEEQKKWLYEKLDLSGIKINKFELKREGDFIPAATEYLELDVPKYASVSGKRIFLEPNLLNKWSYVPSKLEERKTDIVLRKSFIDVDSIVYHVPADYYLEYKPEVITHKSKFGEYNANISIEQGKITYVRTLKIKKNRFPADHYNEFRNFIRQIVKSDKIKIVLKNST